MKQVWRLTLALFCLTVPSAAISNTAECYLEKLPGMQNDLAARQAAIYCNERHGAFSRSQRAGPLRRLLGYSDWGECAADKARDTPSREAANMIATACLVMYEDYVAPERCNPFDSYHTEECAARLERQRQDAEAANARERAAAAAAAARQEAERIAADKAARQAQRRASTPQSPPEPTPPRCVIRSVMTDAEIEICRRSG